jgi:hypothetical protein
MIVSISLDVDRTSRNGRQLSMMTDVDGRNNINRRLINRGVRIRGKTELYASLRVSCQ